MSRRLVFVAAFVLFMTNDPVPAEPSGAKDSRPARTDDSGDPLPDGAVRRLGTLRFRHDGVCNLDWSPDGKVLASVGSWNSNVKLWDAATGKLIRQVGGDCGPLAWSPDGKTLATTREFKNSRIYLWDIATGKEIRSFPENPIITALAWSPDGRKLAATSGDDNSRSWMTRVWDVKSAEVRRRMDVEGAIAWSPDGKTLAVTNHGDIRLWQPEEGTDNSPLKWKRAASDHLVVWSRDGTKLATADAGDTVRVRDVETGKEVCHLDLGWVDDLAWLADGTTLAACDRKGRLVYWDTAGGKVVRRSTCVSGPGGLSGLVARWSPDKKVVAIGDGGSVRLWEAATGKEIRPNNGHTNSVNTLSWSPDGKSLASGSDDGTLRVWEVAPGGEVRRWPVECGQIFSLNWSRGGQELAFVCRVGFEARVGEVHLCGVAAAIKKEYTPKVDIWRGSVGWSPDGKMVAFRGAEEAVHLWELATGKEIRRFSGHQGETTAVAWSPDGQSLASAGQDRTIRLWEASTGKQVRVCVVQGDEKKEEIPFWVSWVHAVAWSPDGKMLASAGSDRTVRIWWVATGREICRCTGHTDKVKAVAWSPDGRTLASGGADRSIRLWETATGKELLRYAGHQDVVNVLSWSPDGKLLASGSQDTTLLVWKDDANDPARLTPAELEACWAALAGDDAAKSHHARCALARDGANAAPFLARRLKPVAAPDPEHVARLIENLDSDEFSTRQKSSDELALLGELAEPALRRAFGKNPSAESRKHLEELLSQLGGWSAEQLRALRAITALERMATREARALLVELSSGAPASRLTHEARASLERLSRAQK